MVTNYNNSNFIYVDTHFDAIILNYDAGNLFIVDYGISMLFM